MRKGERQTWVGGNHGEITCRLEALEIWSHTCTKPALWLGRELHLAIAPEGLINQPQLQYRQTWWLQGRSWDSQWEVWWRCDKLRHGITPWHGELMCSVRKVRRALSDQSNDLYTVNRSHANIVFTKVHICPCSKSNITVSSRFVWTNHFLYYTIYFRIRTVTC